MAKNRNADPHPVDEGKPADGGISKTSSGYNLRVRNAVKIK